MKLLGNMDSNVRNIVRDMTLVHSDRVKDIFSLKSERELRLENKGKINISPRRFGKATKVKYLGNSENGMANFLVEKENNRLVVCFKRKLLLLRLAGM